ncbi:MAG: putative baseplate assembly protein [Dehalococcoidia bacterium]|nr:putative baseplate assembly protein [Dehalococcoidia bacterium]
MSTPFFCCDEQRRAAVMAHHQLNGIDFLEVLDGPDVPDAARQRTLFVHFLKADGLETLSADNVRLEGGERVRPAVVTAAQDPGDLRVLTVTVDEPGDFSVYTLRLVRGPGDQRRPDGFDPLLSAVDFSFKVECPTPFDCADDAVCPPAPGEAPLVDYLARDYASFRRLMLDRLSLTMPGWRERNPADMGIALVELLAYVADRLAYRQDAIATEAYLGTARRRVSVRRHARLVDYHMHDGCNARAWVQVLVDPAAAPAPGLVLPRADTTGPTPVATRFLTRCVESPVLDEGALDGLLRSYAPEVFEPLHDAWLAPEHNEIRFYTWGDARCCLPEGATRATLLDDQAARLRLRPGDILVFEERRGPQTGAPADANRLHRQAVRLTSVTPEATVTIVDGAEQRAPGPIETDPLTGDAIVEVAWAQADALTFPLCISSVTDEAHGELAVADVSVALGNIVLADHGRTIAGEDLGTVPAPSVFLAPVGSSAGCDPQERIAVPPRFRPLLAEGPLTHASPGDPAAALHAAGLAGPHIATARPAATLAGTAPGGSELPWEVVRDLLSSRPGDRDFVVETDDRGRAALRFGDDTNGRRPDEGTHFAATYRVGNGPAGNVGADAIAHVVAAPAVASAIAGVRNPLAAAGGTAPETIEQVRQAAPVAFRTQQRAVTRADYAEKAGLHPEVQQAAAALRWTGSWRTMFVTADRRQGLDVDAGFETALRGHLEPFRMAGQDLEVDAPRPAALELVMGVCVAPGYFRAAVQRELLRVFSRHRLADGRLGIFHPDNFSFGQPVYLARIYAAAQAVAGVESVEVLKLRRRGRPGPNVPPDGKLTFSRIEIPRLDNDRNFPERGTLELIMKGGK